MKRYLAQRLISAAFVLVGVSFIVFLVLHLTPGDPAQILLGPLATPGELTTLRSQLGLDRPMPIQYAKWFSRVVQGDFGRSIVLRRPVLPEIWRRFKATLILTVGGVLVAFPLGTLLGVYAALRRGRWPDRLVTVAAMAGISMPAFWVGLVLIIVFSVRLGWLPGTGMFSPTGTGGIGDLLVHLILPAITLALFPLSVVTRLTRSNMLDVIGQDYIRTARAKGLSERRVITHHALRASLAPIVTMFGMDIALLVGGAIITETIFAWPGVGRLSVQAIYNRDYPVVQCVVFVSAVLFIVINFCVDLVYGLLDPRVRSG